MKIIDKSVLNFCKDNKPEASIESGETLIFRAEDCFGNAVQEETPMGEISLEYSNPAAGPVYVNGAEKGDVLKVEILDIDVNDHGVVSTFAHCGPFQDKNEIRTRILPLDHGVTTFNDVSWITKPMVGVIGDSTFTHSGMTGLLDAVNEGADVTICISDNETTAMTGGQDSAGTGKLERICIALGVEPEHVRTIIPLPKNYAEMEKVIREEIEYHGVSVIVSRRECIQTAKRHAAAKKQ